MASYASSIYTKILLELESSFSPPALEELAAHHTLNVIELLIPVFLQASLAPSESQFLNTMVEQILDSYLQGLSEQDASMVD